MKKTFAAVGVLMLLSLAGCGNDDSPAATAETTTPSPTATAHKLEGVVVVPGLKAGDMAEYTIGSPRMEDGRFTLGVVIANKVGDNLVPGTFELLTTDGRKVSTSKFRDAEDRYMPPAGKLDTSGTMVAGETRVGFIAFDGVSQDQAARLFLYYGTVNPPVAAWELK